MGRRTIDDVLSAAQARLRRLEPRAAYAAMAEGWTLVDLRSAEARRAEGIVPRSIHVPLSVLEWRVDRTSAHRDPRLLGREGRLILLCDGGYASTLAAVRLHELGLTETTDVVGGFAAWRDAGLPVELPVERVAAVILAAGEARRYGARKLLAPLDGRPLLQHVVDAANGSSASEVIVVLGHGRGELVSWIRLGRARAVVNEDHALGQSTSLHAGVRAAADADAVVVLLGDQPLVTSALVDALVARQRETGAAAVMSSRDGRRSPPTLLRRDLFPAVGALEGDVGARAILDARSDVAVLEVGDALGRLDDVDVAADLARIAAR